MKTFFSILVAALFLNVAVSTTRAEVDISVNFFHENLEPYGDWIEVEGYGYCWQPRDVDNDWRPYSDGRWVYTDAGWTWDSDEPYSWAVYHYGRWARIDEVGWVWAPGTEWGPAWVSWRRGSRHVGWAPLPPEARFVRSSGFNVRVDVDFNIGPANYNFVEVRNFGAQRLRTVFIEPRENITIINQTTNITNITYVNSVVYNGGPRYDEISRESAQPVRRLKLDRREQFEGGIRTARAEQLRSRVDGDTLRVAAPAINEKVENAPKKVGRKFEKEKVNRGWKNAGDAEEVEKARNKIKNEPVAVVETPEANPVKAETPSVFAPETTEKLLKEEVGNGNGHKTKDPTEPGKTEVAPVPVQEKSGKNDQRKPRNKSQKPDMPASETSLSMPPEQKEPARKGGKNKNQSEQQTGNESPEVTPPITTEATPVPEQDNSGKKGLGKPRDKSQKPSMPPSETSSFAPPEQEPAKKAGKNKKQSPQAGNESPRVTAPPDSKQKTQNPKTQKPAVQEPAESKPAQDKNLKRKANNADAGIPRKQAPSAPPEKKAGKNQTNRDDSRSERPKSDQPAVRNIDRNSPKKQEQRVETNKPGTGQSNAKPQSAPQEKAGKKKGKKEAESDE